MSSNPGAGQNYTGSAALIASKAQISGQGSFTSYPRTLLISSRTLIDSGQFSIAVVVAHMTCEIAVEATLSEAYAAKGIQYLEDAVDDLLNGYNLANPRVRKLYTALTGDNIQSQPFWQHFTDSAQRRNRIAHAGEIVDKPAAESSHQALTDVLTHLKK